MKSLKAMLGKANNQLLPSVVSPIITLLQVREGGSIRHTYGLSAMVAMGLVQENSKGNRNSGEGICYSNRALSFTSLFSIAFGIAKPGCFIHFLNALC